MTVRLILFIQLPLQWPPQQDQAHIEKHAFIDLFIFMMLCFGLFVEKIAVGLVEGGGEGVCPRHDKSGLGSAFSSRDFNNYD